MKIGIIGAGLIGKKRARFLAGHELVRVADTDLNRAKELAALHECTYSKNWKDVINDKEIDIVIVSTTNDSLAKITSAAIKAKKHVLVEKPAARNPAELKKVLDLWKKSRVKVKVGFNHRYHPALKRAKEIFDSGKIGKLMYIRARYGHGGRLGYEKEWRAKPSISGGGEFLDQGTHLIDLARWFAGDFNEAMGLCDTFYWKMPVEDNCFALLRNRNGVIASLHASCTEWKNLFSFEIFGKTGKIQIDGLGGSYGTESLTLYKMKPQMGPPDIEKYEWPKMDDSWELEFRDFIEAIENNRKVQGNLEDAYKAMSIVFDIYKWSKKHSKKSGSKK